MCVHACMCVCVCVCLFVCVCIGTPKHLDYEEVKNDLNAVEGVKQAHSLHIWSITLNRTALSAHLALRTSLRVAVVRGVVIL